MGFLNDLGSFLGDVQHASDEFSAAKQELFSVGKDIVMNVETQGKEVSAELQSNAESFTQEAKSMSNDVRSQLTD